MERVLTGLGLTEATLPKASKDNQAAVKAAEASFSAYSAKMVPIPKGPISAETIDVIASADGSLASFTVTHPMLAELVASQFAQIESTGTIILPVVQRADGSVSVTEEIVETAISTLQEVHGRVGWLTQGAVESVSLPSSVTDADQQSIGVLNTATVAPSPNAEGSGAFADMNHKLSAIKEDEMVTLVSKCAEVRSIPPKEIPTASTSNRRYLPYVLFAWHVSPHALVLAERLLTFKCADPTGPNAGVHFEGKTRGPNRISRR